MPQLFEIRAGAESVGSYSADEIQQMAADGRLHAGMEIRRLPSGEWAPISRVKGLRFKPLDSADAVAPEPIEAQDNGASVLPATPLHADQHAPNAVVANLAPETNAVQAEATQPPAPSPTSAATGAAEIECPFCAELIKAAAKKCKHCGEFLYQQHNNSRDANNIGAGNIAPRPHGGSRPSPSSGGFRYSVSKTIRRPVSQDRVFAAIREKFGGEGTVRESGDGLQVIGFNKNLGGINYSATAAFAVNCTDGKTIITASIAQRPTFLFFCLLFLGILFWVVGAGVPVIFYYLGKTFVTRAVQKGLDEIAEELS